MYKTLVSADVLAEHLEDANWRIVDCRFELSDPAAGENAWRHGHIPGAVYAHLDRDLTAPVTASSGRHPLPDPDRLQERLSGWGIDSTVQVVAYDASGGAMAARLWWLLRWLGHESAAVLDGGWQEWNRRGLTVSDHVVLPSRRVFERRPPLATDISGDEIQHARQALQLVDARAPERFRGDVEPIDAVAGHIPGASNRPFAGNLDAAGRFLSGDELRDRFAAFMPARAVHYCGSGVTACHNLLAMEHAGLHGSRLYAGSWSEWIRDPARPVARGEDENP